MFKTFLRLAFFLLIVRPLVLIGLGLNVRNGAALPRSGPAVIVANHNSHLDSLVIISLFPLALLPKVRPLAAADYFLRNPVLAWFALNIIGIIPVSRQGEGGGNPLASGFDALRRDEILIVFPEGTRGTPEERSAFKKGVSLISRKFPEVPVVPLFLHGLGKALPRGEAILVPFFCDIFIGDAIRWAGDGARFMGDLERQIADLAARGDFPQWD